MASDQAGRRPVRRHLPMSAVLAVLAVLALAASMAACGEAPASARPTSTLDPLSIRLVEWYDPVALAADHEWGQGCAEVARSGEPQANEVHAFWTVDCPRGPGDRTIYFLLEEDTKAAIEAAGGRIGSGSGQGNAERGLLSQSWEFSMPGATGFGRVTSTDVGEDQIRILITLDIVAG